MPLPRIDRLYGLTHSIDNTPLVRVPRVVKVQIGHTKGPEVSTWIAPDGKWRVSYNSKLKAYEGEDRKRAEAIYADLVRSAQTGTAPTEVKGPVCNMRKFPGKLPFFTFSRMRGDGSYEPDWDTIEAHGHCPTEIEIVFTDDRPFTAQYQMWTAADLKCTGDGINALRVVTMPSGYEAAAAAAAKGHEKRFLIEGGCHTCGCPFAQPEGKKAPLCKPHGMLQFQLVSSLRLGGVAQFDTTSYRSISQLFSCIHQFLAFTGNGNPERGFLAGIPLKLILRPFRTEHGTAYATSLEFRAESIEAMRQKILDAGRTFRQVIDIAPAAPQPALAAAKQALLTAPDEASSSAFESEFVEAAEPVTDAAKIAAATSAGTAALAERLAKAKAQPAVVIAEVVEEPTVEETGDIDGEANEDLAPPQVDEKERKKK